MGILVVWFFDTDHEVVTEVREVDYYDLSDVPMVQVDAPLQNAQVHSDDESITLWLVSSMPDTCHTFSGFHVQREGRFLLVELNNQRPADLSVWNCQETDEHVTGWVKLDRPPPNDYLLVVNGEETGSFPIK